MKTEAEKIEISKQAAEIVGKEAPRGYLPGKACVGMTERWGMADHGSDLILGWLVDDHSACAEIAADRRITSDQSYEIQVIAVWNDHNGTIRNTRVDVADFPSRIEATNWAILTAVVEQSKECGK